MRTININLPLTKQDICELKTGDKVLLSGTIYTARDKAHKQLVGMIARKEPLSFEIKNSVLYYTGPIISEKSGKITSAGPTTSSRMDDYTPPLLQAGVKALIGKGSRSAVVKEELKKHNALYLCAVGGAGVVLADRIVSHQIIAFPELGLEAVYKLEVKDFPCYVAIDVSGRVLMTE
jgi:fumarate hydratase subunit beta